ncbi:ATP-binding cassette domain-containing protein [Paenibacillus sp. GCM10023248]|uniref:ABC transporter ATP-binding protein n=1 Tax=Bacillales TaxID=1385 RepID=UPI0023784E2E|nr:MULTISPECIES: ABC transporter ATP-binding protein [Bacillales]MDD9267721.1 ABC transporter ATP-binding protein [Paenibacillus sp. MAHUQ-63]MDR6882181.1 ABC-2 type transport system ATP-binding protein [Bacillus sp. 3255]
MAASATTSATATTVPTTVLSVKNLKKRIKNKEIIKGISFDVYAGEIFGFLGPNGSGKTTTIRMLVDLIRPTEGSIEICGYDVRKQHNQAMRHIGCIVENPELYSYLTGWENLEHFARMLPDVGEERIQEVVDIVSMDARIHDKVRTYSLGMRQRLGIAQALLGRPSLLILDEPTNGLDPQGIKEMREFIQRLAEGGLSLFVSSHLLSEIQQMCDRVAIISHGQVIQVGAVDDLIAQGGKVVWSVSPADKAEGLLDASPLVHAIEEIAQDEHHLTQSSVKQIVTQMDKEHVPQLSRELMEAGISLFAVEIKNPTLEDLFLSLTEGETIH